MTHIHVQSSVECSDLPRRNDNEAWYVAESTNSTLSLPCTVCCRVVESVCVTITYLQLVVVLWRQDGLEGAFLCRSAGQATDGHQNEGVLTELQCLLPRPFAGAGPYQSGKASTFHLLPTGRQMEGM